MHTSCESTTSATSARDRDTKESLELPSSRLGPSREVPLLVPTGVGSIFRLFSGEMKLANKLLSDESVGSLGHHWGSWVGEAIQSGWGLLDGEGRLLELSLPFSFAGERGTPSPYWPELMAISMMESLMCVAGSPCESTSSGGPGSEMSSRAETLGGESRVLEASDGGSGVESPLWTGALDSSDKERTGGFWKLSATGSCLEGTLMNGSLVAPTAGSGSPFWWGPVESGPVTAAVTSSEDSGAMPDKPSVSRTGRGLPGMMPALLAARSIALARGPVACGGRTLGTIGRDTAALAREDWTGRKEPLPVTEEFDRMEKEQTLWDWFSDGLGSSVLWTTSGFRRCRFRSFLGFGRKKSDCMLIELRCCRNVSSVSLLGKKSFPCRLLGGNVVGTAKRPPSESLLPVLVGLATKRGLGGFLRPEEQGTELGEKALLWRRAAWFRGQRGLRELTVTTFPGGGVDCSSWAGLTEAVEPVFVSGASRGLTSVEMSFSRQLRRRCLWKVAGWGPAWGPEASGPSTASQSYSSCSLLGLPIMR